MAFSYGMAILAPIYAWAGPGFGTPKWAFAAIGAVWSLRLSTYILLRVIRHHPRDDARYASLRLRWPARSGSWASSSYTPALWGFFLAALGSPYGWISIACPLLMLYFLLRVTGIPLTEEFAVRSKGDAYREYQRATSAFVPWFRRGMK